MDQAGRVLPVLDRLTLPSLPSYEIDAFNCGECAPLRSLAARRVFDALAAACSFGRVDALEELRFLRLEEVNKYLAARPENCAENSGTGTSTENAVELLCVAAENGHSDVVEWLLAQEVPADSREPSRIPPYGMSPLEVAASAGHVNVAQRLLAAGVDPNATNAVGTGPVHDAAAAGHLEALKLLLHAGARPFNEGEIFPAIVFAAIGGHAACVSALLDAGAPVDAMFGEGPMQSISSLQAAAANGHLDAVKVLLTARATIEAESRSPLVMAAAGGHTSVIKELIERGARVDKPKVWCASAHALRVIAVLTIVVPVLVILTPLVMGVALMQVSNSIDPSGTPIAIPGILAFMSTFFFMTQSGQARTKRCAAALERWFLWLTSYFRRHFGMTPLYVAARNGHLEAVQALLAAEARVDQQVDLVAVAGTDHHVCRDVLRSYPLGCPLNVDGLSRYVPQTTAELPGLLEGGGTFFSLITAGWAFGTGMSACSYGSFETPLYAAAAQGHLPVVRALLGAGARKSASRHGGPCCCCFWKGPAQAARAGGHEEVAAALDGGQAAFAAVNTDVSLV